MDSREPAPLDAKDGKSESNMGGWNAIADTFDRLYPHTLEQTKQYGTLIPWCLGGNDPLDQVRIYDGGAYWHFVTFGLSELYEKESDNPELSGYGMEFTLKLKKQDTWDEEQEIRCVIGILQDFARLTFQEGELFQPFEYIYTGQTQGIDVEMKSPITGFITIPEPLVSSIQTPNGQVDFVELIGVTDAELQQILNHQLRVKALYEALGTDLTDYSRTSVV